MTANRVERDGSTSLLDGYGRVARSLRLSVTDRCNLRCLYCMPAGDIPWFPKARILTFEEIERVAIILAAMGVREIRLTGGEPLMRRDLAGLAGVVLRFQGGEGIGGDAEGRFLR